MDRGRNSGESMLTADTADRFPPFAVLLRCGCDAQGTFATVVVGRALLHVPESSRSVAAGPTLLARPEFSSYACLLARCRRNAKRAGAAWSLQRRPSIFVLWLLAGRAGGCHIGPILMSDRIGLFSALARFWRDFKRENAEEGRGTSNA